MGGGGAAFVTGSDFGSDFGSGFGSGFGFDFGSGFGCSTITNSIGFSANGSLGVQRLRVKAKTPCNAAEPTSPTAKSFLSFCRS
jgi:hypothetical protein